MSIVFLLAILISPLSYPSYLIFRISDFLILFCSLHAARKMWINHMIIRARYILIVSYVALSIIFVNLQSDLALVFTLLYKILFPFLCFTITLVFLKTKLVNEKNIAITLYVSWLFTLFSSSISVFFFAATPGFRLSFPPHIPLLVDAHIFSGYLIFSALLTEINLNLKLLPKSLGSSRLIFYPLTLLLVYFTQSRTGLILGVLCIICYLGNSLLKTSIKLRLNITSSLIIGSTILFAFLVLFSSTPL